MFGVDVPDQYIVALIAFALVSLSAFFVWLVKTIVRILELMASMEQRLIDHDKEIQKLKERASRPFPKENHR